MDVNTQGSIPLFADAPKRRRKQIASWVDELEVPTDTMLTKGGGVCARVLRVRLVQRRVQQDGDPTMELGEGDFLGEAGMLSSARRHTETVVTTSTTRLLVIAPREFASLILSLPVVADRIRQRVS